MENKELIDKETEITTPDSSPENTANAQNDNEPIDKNVRLMSPLRMVMRRFFRSKLSVVGMCLLIGLFLFCWIGPLVYTQWGSSEADMNGKLTYTQSKVTYTDDDGNTLISHTPALGYNIVILSSPNLVKGQTYTLAIGSQTSQVKAN